MYCKEYNCLFVHIPKTAGKSIESHFLNLLGLSWDQRAPLLLRPNDDPQRGPERLAHLTATEYVALGYLTQEQFDSAYRFTFVRNPWARLVSEYRYRKFYLRFSFRDFVLLHLPAPDMSDAYRHILPQSDYVFDEHGELQVNFVGHFEKLQDDFDAVCRDLGQPPQKLSHFNAGSGANLSWGDRIRQMAGISREADHGHYSAYYDDETRARVAKLYARDITAFGYSFENQAIAGDKRD